MTKQLIILCDGTGNSPEVNKDNPTNVQIFFNALKTNSRIISSSITGVTIVNCTLDETERMVYYCQGLGISTKTQWRFLERAHDYLFGQGGAIGITGNVIEVYKFLVNNYKPEDEVFLFGFSRGAYTLRIVTTLLRHFGLIDKNNLLGKNIDDVINEMIGLYDINIHPDENEKISKFRANYSYKNSDGQVQLTGLIKFLGLWDSVPGVILETIRSDKKLTSVVKVARHALSIDERRQPFDAEIWVSSSETDSEQRWFSGVHSDVGGGYKERKLANISLNWMVEESKKYGLNFDFNFLNKHYPIDKNEALLPVQHDSYVNEWKILPYKYRYICCTAAEEESIDPSVFVRYGKIVSIVTSMISSEYFPPNLTRTIIAIKNFKKFASLYPPNIFLA